MDTHLKFQVAPGITNDFSYNRYVHNYGHDNLSNLVARESTDPETNKPGGKMLTHEDLDPGGMYGITVTDLTNKLKVGLGEYVDVGWKFQKLDRQGYDQSRSINHCSMCHITGRRTMVDETELNHTVGVAVATQKVRVLYKALFSDFTNNAGTPTNYYDAAKHPVNGDMEEEFASRLVYQDEELDYNRIPDTEKQAHIVKFDGVINDTNSLVGQFTYDNLKNIILNEILPSNDDYDKFIENPMSIWIEDYFGIHYDSEENRFVRQNPRSLTGINGAADILSHKINVPVEKCIQSIQKWLLAGYECIVPSTNFRVFAFRLHQFISRGDTAYSSPI